MIEQIEAVVKSKRASNVSLKEEETKQSIIEPILSALQWDMSNLNEAQREYKNVVDYVLRGERSVVCVEAKKLGSDLRSAERQVKDY